MKTILLLSLVITVAACSSTKKNLVGYWYKPKTMINVRFYPNKTFEYNDYDSVANKSQKLTGKYTIDGSAVKLQFADKTTETLTVEKSTADNAYHLKRGDYYLIKDERVNHAVPPATNPK